MKLISHYKKAFKQLNSDTYAIAFIELLAVLCLVAGVTLALWLAPTAEALVINMHS